FLIDYRMHCAANLLYNSAMNIQQISEAVGYEDQMTFSKAFKKKFGVSPSSSRTPTPPPRVYHQKPPPPPFL
ncbi:MAG: helix-turn-helix transcriptional regulator, partial [Lachnospiraceae bacterium]|nr:helix-turn-helix transcriptional regulator [Lachnospiraceae bacterium]